MKKILSVMLALVIIFSFAACSGADAPGVSESPAVSEEPSGAVSPSAAETPSNEPETRETVNAGFLKGPTGIGAAYLMEQNEKGETALDYNVTIEADVANINSALISGALDLAAVPTNVASVLYNKTNGNTKIIAINTLSVLYILEKGNSISSMADLKGKTIYATGQASNPEYVLNYLLRQNGLEPGKDVTVEFMDSTELATQMASGAIDVCMLPAPNSTTVLMKNSEVREALNLGEEWDIATGGESMLTQGCIVARADLQNLEQIVEQFLKDYQTSIEYMSDEANIDVAAELAFKFEIVPNAAIAKAAIPDCNLTFIAGTGSIKSSISGYYEILFEADPTSIGGKLPDDSFYFGG
jgi:NitT/TauT family transport system substrate-binding protein